MDEELKLDAVGYDDLSRQVLLTFAESFEALHAIRRSEAFALVVGGDSSVLSVDAIADFAEAMLEREVVYVLAWGPGCERFEDIVDETHVFRDIRDNVDRPVVMTTSHGDDSILEALEFATTVAVSGEPLTSRVLVVAFFGNVNWYNEAQNCLEGLLTSEPKRTGEK